MKYLVRVVKYFIWFALIFIIIMAILVLLGLAESNPAETLRNGYKSLWQIAILFFLVAVLYPKFGFTTKDVLVPGEYSQIRDGIINSMESRGYRLESEEGEDMTFRLRSKVSACMKMFEDRITLKRTATGFTAEGLTKEVVRVVSAIEYKFRNDS